jgi:adenylate cyclase class IV
MREVELKAVVDDLTARRRLLERAGARCTFQGRLEDRRYDSTDRALAERAHVLRLRVYRDEGGTRAELGWKGETRYEDGYKVREELQAALTDPDGLADILRHLGYVVTRAIDREIVQYDLDGTTIRFEHYPRMDDLVEVEGTPEGIEHTIGVLGMPRAAFTTDRLPHFVRRYQERTGEHAVLSDDELRGVADYSLEDA